MNPENSSESVPGRCPVCGAAARSCEQRHSAAAAAAQFCPPRRDAIRNGHLNATIERLWHSQCAEHFVCPICGFGFPVPHVSGDEAFYALLHEDTAYPSWRWEYGVALREIDGSAPGAALLDIGAGDGAFLAHVNGSWGKWAVEASPAMRAALGSGDVHVLAGMSDAPEGTFDVVTMFQVLEHLADHQTTIATCLRLLKPGGRLYVSVPDGVRIREWARVTGLPDMPPFHVAQWTPPSIGRALTAAGFIDVRTARDPWSLTNLTTLLSNSLRAAAGREGALASRIWTVKDRAVRRALFAAVAAVYTPRLTSAILASPALCRGVVLLARATRPVSP